MPNAVAAYESMIRDLLPRGRAWAQDRYSVLSRLLRVAAVSYAAIDSRATALIEESDPRAASELLAEWESVAGLPDSCTQAGTTAEERRHALVMRLTGIGGQSRAYFTGLATALGYTVSIAEYRPFVAGVSRCSRETLNGGHAVRHTWRATIWGARLTPFQAGVSRCGEKLLSIAVAADLECILRRLKPAHTHLVIAYQALPGTLLTTDSGQVLTNDAGQSLVAG